MTYNLAFSLLNASVIPAWVVLLFLPGADVTKTFVHSAIYPVTLGIFYTFGFGLTLLGGAGSEDVNFITIEGVRAIFDSDIGILIGWSHYLVFDLFIGAWIGRDAQRLGITHWFAAPSMLLTFLLGPLGLLIYIIGRYIATRTLTLQED